MFCVPGPSPRRIATVAAIVSAEPPPSPWAHFPLEDVAPYVAQSGFKAEADVLAHVTSGLHEDERVWRAISRLSHGLFSRTRLAFAARRGDLRRCVFLVEHGARVDARDTFGRTPIMEARAGGHDAVVSFLLSCDGSEDPPFRGEHAALWPASDAAAAAVAAGGPADGVWALTVIADGRVAIAHRTGAIHLRNATTGAITATITHAGGVVALRALPCGRLISAGSDSAVKVWRVDTRVCEHTLAGHTSFVTSLAVLRDARLASGGGDRTVRLWSTLRGSAHIVLAVSSIVCSLVALPCGGLAGGGRDGAIALWSASGVRTATLRSLWSLGSCYALSVMPDGHLAAGYSNTSVRLWNLGQHRVVDSTSGRERHRGFVNALAVLPDGTLMSGSWDKSIKQWSVTSGSAAAAAAAALTGDVGCGSAPSSTGGAMSFLQTLPGHTHCVSALAILLPREGGGTRLLSGSLDGTVRVWV